MRLRVEDVHGHYIRACLGLDKPRMKLFDLTDDVFSENSSSATVKANDDAEKSVFAVRFTRNGTANTKFQFD